MEGINVIASSLITPLGDATETLNAIANNINAFKSYDKDLNIKNSKIALIKSDICDSDNYSSKLNKLAYKVGTTILDSIDNNILNERNIGLVFATSYGHLLDNEPSEGMSEWARRCTKALGFEEEPVVVSTACSAGSDAVGIACSMLEEDLYEAIIIIAVDIVTDAKRLAHSALGTMSTDILKPFDIDRSGMLIGDGAAALLLSKNEKLKSRARIIGYGASNDATGLTTPDITGKSVEMAINRAIKSAAVQLDDIAIYYAHGTGTKFNDQTESLVINKLFNSNKDLKIVGTKGAIGHSLGACGLIELILLIEILKNRKLVPTVGLEKPIDIVSDRFDLVNDNRLKNNIGLTVTLGFGGFNTAIIVESGEVND